MAWLRLFQSAVDPSDVLLYTGARLQDAADVEVLAEASMHPDVSQLLQLFAAFVRCFAESKESTDGLAPAPGLAALRALVLEMPTGASQRTELVRATLARLSRALDAVRGGDNAITRSVEGLQHCMEGDERVRRAG